MSIEVQEWIKELKEVDTFANVTDNLDRLEQIYLESSDADDRKLRVEMIWLLKHFKVLFK